ncbi:MAG: hypothetical protein R3C97_08490 [Geminicoccaceae bacterium]
MVSEQEAGAGREGTGAMLGAAQVHPDWWPLAFAGAGADGTLLQWLADAPRSKARLFGCLLERRNVPLRPVEATSTLGRMLALDEGRFERLLCRFGLVWNRALLAREIDRRVLQGVIERVGEKAFRRTLSQPVPSGRTLLLGESGGIDPDNLLQDGNLCLQLWMAGQPRREVAQLGLRLSPQAPSTNSVSAEDTDRARAIVQFEVHADD